MLWVVPLLPVIAGALVWAGGSGGGDRGAGRRVVPGSAAAATLAATAGLAAWAAVDRPSTSYRWGSGLRLELAVDDPASVAVILVPAVGFVVVAYAAAHEPTRALGRLLGTLVAFVGAMELLVLAADLLTLLVAWELVGAFSWVAIAHRWWEVDKPTAATHAFLATRAGDLGLFAAAGGALAGTGSLAYADLGRLESGWLDLVVAGVFLAAAAKSAQLPFSPWLFSAMGGPTSVSALLHAATMVAAGAYILVRLHPVLDAAGWFAPAAIGVGLATALAGGVVALAQQHAKQLLAASTSAHYGLMFVAAGAGVPAAALAHLVAHAAFKAPLFLSAGIAMEASGSPLLGRMRLGRALPALAAVTALCSLALAGVPPLGGAWTKESVVAAAGHHAPWLAVAVATAGALSAGYAARFQLLGFGPPPHPGPRSLVRWPGPVELAAVAVGGVASLALGLLWLPGGEGVVERLAGGTLPAGTTWEVALSLGAVGLALYAASVAHRQGRLLGDPLDARRRAVADWFALPAGVAAAVVDPVRRLAVGLGGVDGRVVDAPVRAAAAAGRRVAAAVARGDDRVVDAGVRAAAAVGRLAARAGSSVAERGIDGALRDVAGLVGAAAADARRSQTGLAHQYYVVVAAGVLVLLVAVIALR